METIKEYLGYTFAAIGVALIVILGGGAIFFILTISFSWLGILILAGAAILIVALLVSPFLAVVAWITERNVSFSFCDNAINFGKKPKKEGK